MVIGKNYRGALVTLLERKSLCTVIKGVSKAPPPRAAIIAGLTPHKNWVHRLAYDNAKELTEHEQIAGMLVLALVAIYISIRQVYDALLLT